MSDESAWNPIRKQEDGFISAQRSIDIPFPSKYYPFSQDMAHIFQNDLSYILKLDIVPFWSTLVHNPLLSTLLLSILSSTADPIDQDTMCLELRVLCRIYAAPDQDGFTSAFGCSDPIERWKACSSKFHSLPVLLVYPFHFYA